MEISVNEVVRDISEITLILYVRIAMSFSRWTFAELYALIDHDISCILICELLNVSAAIFRPKASFHETVDWEIPHSRECQFKETSSRARRNLDCALRRKMIPIDFPSRTLPEVRKINLYRGRGLSQENCLYVCLTSSWGSFHNSIER